jgi:hypothetical protein
MKYKSHFLIPFRLKQRHFNMGGAQSELLISLHFQWIVLSIRRAFSLDQPDEKDVDVDLVLKHSEAPTNLKQSILHEQSAIPFLLVPGVCRYKSSIPAVIILFAIRDNSIARNSNYNLLDYRRYSSSSCLFPRQSKDKDIDLVIF